MANITKFDEKMFAAAHKEDEKSDFDSFHMGCVIVYKGAVLAKGCNSDKTHPMQAKYNKWRFACDSKIIPIRQIKGQINSLHL